MSQVYLRLNAADTFRKMVTDSENEVRWSFTFDNLENPTQYVSERAVRLRLPVCPENNKFFGQFLRLDSTITANGYTPTEKMQYIVMDDGAVVSTGTAVIESIDRQYYNLSLVGSQATLFRKLMNAGYDTAKAAEDNTYYLMKDWLKCSKVGAMVIDEQANLLNRFQVLASWTIDEPILDFPTMRTTADLRSAYGITDANITETMAFIASLVGFAPTAQGKYGDFESDMWLETGKVEYIGQMVAAAAGFLPVLCSERDEKGEAVETVSVEDGLVEPQIGEYRSYYQQPYIYLGMLWQFFAYEMNQICGYTLRLDSRWFEDVGMTAYMLPKTFGSDNVKPENVPVTFPSGGISNTHVMPNGYVRTTNDPPFAYTISGLSLKTTATSGSFHVKTGKKVTVDVLLDLRMDNFAFSQDSRDDNSTYYWSGYNPYEFRVSIINRNDVAVSERKFLVYPVSSDGVMTLSGMQRNTHINDAIIGAVYVQSSRLGFEILTPEYDAWSKTDPTNPRLRIQAKISSVITEDDDYRIRCSIGYSNDKLPFVLKGGASDVFFYSASPGSSQITIERYNVTADGSAFENNRSDSIITLEKLFGDKAPFEVLLEYSKARHLMWVVDDAEKVVTVKRAADFFADAGDDFADLTKFADGDVEISPLSWESNRVVFNLGELECDYVDGYSDRYGHGYGDKVVVTTNNLNKDSKSLLSGKIVTSAMLSQNVVPIALLFGRERYPNAIEVPPMPMNVKDGESADISGNFYVRDINGEWPKNILHDWKDDGRAYITLSDDADIERARQQFCWHGKDVTEADDEKVYVRPVFTTVDATGTSVLFGPVREVYTSQSESPSSYLYEQHWQHYIEEVYNPENKTIACKIFFTRRLLAAVRENPIVRIGNLLYLVMSIGGWSNHTRLCRCKLRQINDLNNLRR